MEETSDNFSRISNPTALSVDKKMVASLDGFLVEALEEWRAKWQRHRGASKSIGESLLRRSREVCNFGHLTEVDLHNYGARVARCGSYLVFGWYPRLQRIKLLMANFCHLPLLCPSCSHANTVKAVDTYLPRFNYLLTEQPDLVPQFLTITLPAGPDIRERTDTILSVLSEATAWSNRARKKHSRQDTELGKIMGGISRLHVRPTPVIGQDFFQVHLHAVVLASETLVSNKLRREIATVMAEPLSQRAVDVRPFHNTDLPAAAEDFRRLMEYSWKDQDLNVDQKLRVFTALQGVRLTRVWGAFWNTPVPIFELAAVEPASLSGPDFLRVRCDWHEAQNLVITGIRG